MELAVFIQKLSDEVAAELFDVPRRTIAAWRRMERAPGPLQSLEIIEKSGGEISWEGIYRPYARYRLRQKNQQNRQQNQGV
ncbi:hypothetical protein [Kistimonas asteriae]|uniref:hypothetical protein n=1 Tax=Kistimonas asteriae TaxID=517724 RepID=UPI001BAD649D|nr:hypothetical protein [Kistimonas asteriae]